MTRSLVVKGFRWAGVSAGIKSNGKPDLALLVADDGPVEAAAVFTRNLVRAAPVEVAERRVRGGKVRAVLVNSGNANACTGPAGHRATLDTTLSVARAIRAPAREVVPASTGVIGRPLPAARIVKAVPSLVAALSPLGVAEFSEAILTTDRGPKVASAEVRVGRDTVRLVAVAKGAGMIHPNMATTLGFVATDAQVGTPLLRAMLRTAADGTFNAVTVDGDTSTNDTLLLLASGAVGPRLRPGTREAARFLAGLTAVLHEVSEMIVADGEGAEHVVRVEVSGARSDADARAVASTVARSLLVKTALYGKDPNWGRIFAAAGRAGVRFDPRQVEIRVGGVALVVGGTPTGAAAEARVAKVMRAPKYSVEVRIGRGRGTAHYLTCDLGHGYVNVNADYRT